MARQCGKTTCVLLISATLQLGAGTAGAREWQCVLLPNKVSVLSAPREGQVKEVRVKRGQLVEPGQVLAMLEASDEQLVVKLSEFKANMEAPLASATARLNFEKSRYDRLYSLQQKRTISDLEVEESENALRVAEAELLAVQEQMKLAELEHERAQSAYERKIIRATHAGVVSKVLVKEGEYADPPDLIEISGIDPLRVDLLVEADLLHRVTKTSIFQVDINLPTSRSLSASPSLIDKVIDPASGTFLVRLEIDNSNMELTSGTGCLAHLIDEESGDPSGPLSR